MHLASIMEEYQEDLYLLIQKIIQEKPQDISKIIMVSYTIGSRI